MRNLHFWQNLLNREKITLFIGSLVLFLGAIFPWYRLPNQALETFGTNLYFTNLARILAAIFAILALAGTFLLRITRVQRLLFWLGLITVLLFPYFVTTWTPTISFLASNYYSQGERVSSHIDKKFSNVQAQWKQNISLAKPVIPSTTFDMSIQDSRFFEMSSWDKIIMNGFGYKNSFFGFIGKGWFFCLLGLSISLIGLYLGLENQSLQAFLQDIKKILPGTVLLFSIILTSIITINIVNYQLDIQFAKSEYTQVVNTSKALTILYPPLQGDKSFLTRLARAEFYSGKTEPALINFVKGLERYTLYDFQKAEEFFQKSLDREQNRFLVRGYLASAILNQGVDYINDPNTRKPGAAADIFEKVLQYFPNHMEAMYDLMLARVVNGEFQKSAEIARQIIDGQQYFQHPILGLVGQAYLHLSWAAYNHGDVNKTWREYRQSFDSRTWKESNLQEQ